MLLLFWLLLQWQAGGDIDEDNEMVDAADDDEADINIGDRLLEVLRLEVRDIQIAVGKRDFHKGEKGYVCPACPFRAFYQKERLKGHIIGYHTATQQYVCSGTKQMKIIAALYDHDMLNGVGIQQNYISRSVSVLRLGFF
jgi:hypothetical protein